MLTSAAIEPLIAVGQLPVLTTPRGTQPLPIGVERQGTLESAGIHLDRKELFRIASLAVLDRSAPNGQIPVEIRAKQIEANLDQLLTSRRSADETPLDPQTLRVAIETVNEQPVLFVKDAVLAEAKVLLTVTDPDAQYASISKERLAERWREILERELRQAIALRQPKALRQQILTVVKALVATVLSTLGLGAVWAFLGRRKQQLEQQQAAETALLHTQELTPISSSYPQGITFSDSACF
ncbi:hypothetical protein [Phormidesmis priestleyi]